MKTIIKINMGKLKKIVFFYILGTILTFWALALIHLNYSLIQDFFWRSSWRNVFKNSIVSGAPVGAAFWIFLTYKFPTSPLDFKFIVSFLKPYFYNYLIGILIAFGIIEGIELYTYLFSNEYLNLTYYNIFGFSVLLGIPIAIIYHNIKTLKQ